jgi:trigger factor
MKVTLDKIDSVNATLTIEIVNDDYEQKVKQKLKDIKCGMDFPGFRKGMAPASLIEKKYAKAVLIEEVEKLLQKQLNTYLKESKLHLLGEPIPHGQELFELNFETADGHQYMFDLGLAPELNTQLTKDDILPYYSIAVTDEMIESKLKSIKSSRSVSEDVDQFEGNDIVRGLLVELNEEDEPLENGICNDQAVLLPSFLNEEEEKNKFLGAKLNDVLIFNPFKAYQGSAAELASFLKIRKEEVNNHTGNFSFTINNISRNKEAELNQELFDKIYEPGTVTSEEQFCDKIKETIAGQLIVESDYKFLFDAHALLMEKNKDVQFPDEFLKRWFLVSDNTKTPEWVEENYPGFISMLKQQLIRDKIVSENNISYTEEELLAQAKTLFLTQFAQYGMVNLPDDLVEQYAREMLKKEKSENNLIEKVIESKMMKVLKDMVTIELKETTLEELKKHLSNPEEQDLPSSPVIEQNNLE